MEPPPDTGSGAPIRFGTSGWRGILADDFTFSRLRAALHAVGQWLAREAPGGEVVIAHDTRFLGERMAETAASILAHHGAVPVLGRGPTATPVAARAVVRRGAAAGVIFTASHNPPEYQGMKIFGPWGGGIEDRQARQIEELARRSPAAAPSARGGRRVDLVAPYVRELSRLLDRRVLERSRLCVVYDAMHGTGAGVLDGVLEGAKLRVRVRRGAPDPRFGGAAPDPAPQRLRDLCREVRNLRGLRLGLATDGDADRFGAVDVDGRMLAESEALALLVDHLAQTGRIERGVAISVATGSLVERVAAGYGLRVTRHPIGFKHLSRALVSGVADVAGEESGGFAFAGLGRDKDGILAGCLLAELAARTRAPLRERLAELHRRHGRSASGRIATPAAARARATLGKLVETPPSRVDGHPVRAARCENGLHLTLDDGFLMLRASGTEPLLRIYAEAPGPRLLQRRLAAGRRLLEVGG